MSTKMPRREFLIAAPAAVGALATATHAVAAAPAAPIASTTLLAARDYAIQPKRYADVTLNDAFWKPKVDRNAQITIPFEVSKRGDNGGASLNGNVLEAAILSLATHPNTELQRAVDARIAALRNAAPANSNRGFEVAATYFNVTGKRDLVELAIRSADMLIENFRANDPPFSGGERDAMNSIALYRVTGDRKHLDLARHYLDSRGRADSVGRSRHNQSHMMTRDMDEAVGHAVNCVTLMLSLLDYGVLSGDRRYTDAAQRMWTDAVTRKMYVTGGVGSTGNEGFGEAYSLPNISAYAETCAVLMFTTLNQRLFQATGDAKYIDVLERGLYNNLLSGVATSGDHYFYVNRLASAGDGRDLRWQHASLECCPPNLVRLMAQMPGYIYAQDAARNAVYVNLYVSSNASFDVNDGRVTLDVASGMPYDGETRIRVAAPAGTRAALKLRIPGWARNQPVPGNLYTYADVSDAVTVISVNGTPVKAIPDKLGYVTIDRRWQDGDTVELEFPMPVRRVVADARVKDDVRRMAIERGPIVYCAEWPDCPDAAVLNLMVDRRAPMEAMMYAGQLGDAWTIRTEARSIVNPSLPAKPMHLIPYHLWANRGAGQMTVWLPVEGYAPGDIGPAGGYIFYDNPNYATDGWRYLEAAPFDQSMGAKWGCFRSPTEGARGTSIGTGRRNTADILAACRETDSAAALCEQLSINGVSDWFLPSTDELVAMYKNLRATNLADFRDQGLVDNVQYWASSQYSTDMAAHVDFADNGRLHHDDKDFPRRVRAIRAF
jgi:DUF1680 family protein